MTRRLIGMLPLLLAAAVSAPAQSLETTVDLTPLGLANYDVPRVEADGDSMTKEWLAVPRNALVDPYRVLAQSPTTGALCLGPWFLPAVVTGWISPSASLANEDGRHKLTVRPHPWFGPSPGLQASIRLERPPCP